MKKIIALISTVCAVMCIGITVYAYDTVNLPKTMTLSDAMGIFSINDITGATVSVPEEGKYITLSKEQYAEFFDRYAEVTLTRYITPSPFRGPSINITTSSDTVSYYAGAGVQVGMFGFTNYICYRASGDDEDNMWDIADWYYDNDAKSDGNQVNIKNSHDYYSDPSDPWAKDAVRQAADRCLVPYEFVGKYNDSITREQFCILCGNLITVAANYPTFEAYAADKGIWWQYGTYADCWSKDLSIDILCSMGVVNGISDTEFNPDATITREEAAKLLCKTAEQFRYISTPSSAGYNDSWKIADWAKFYVDWVTQTGIMNGSDGNFNPKDNYTVEQALITINRLYDYVR